MVAIVCGSVGWNPPSLMQSFYPDDLPEDWRLTYYANEFSAVLLPPSTWRDVSLEQLQAWRDDVSQSFRFFFLCDGECATERLQLLSQALGSNFGGVITNTPLNYVSGIVNFPVLNSENCSVVVGLLSDDDMQNLKSLHSRIEDLVAANPAAETIYLFLDSEKSLYKSLKSVQMLLEVSGY